MKRSDSLLSHPVTATCLYVSFCAWTYCHRSLSCCYYKDQAIYRRYLCLWSIDYMSHVRVKLWSTNCEVHQRDVNMYSNVSRVSAADAEPLGSRRVLDASDIKGRDFVWEWRPTARHYQMAAVFSEEVRPWGFKVHHWEWTVSAICSIVCTHLLQLSCWLAMRTLSIAQRVVICLTLWLCLSVREYVFYVFFRFQKNMTFNVFFKWPVKKRKKSLAKI